MRSVRRAAKSVPAIVWSRRILTDGSATSPGFPDTMRGMPETAPPVSSYAAVTSLRSSPSSTSGTISTGATALTTFDAPSDGTSFTAAAIRSAAAGASTGTADTTRIILSATRATGLSASVPSNARVTAPSSVRAMTSLSGSTSARLSAVLRPTTAAKPPICLPIVARASANRAGSRPPAIRTTGCPHSLSKNANGRPSPSGLAKSGRRWPGDRPGRG